MLKILLEENQKIATIGAIALIVSCSFITIRAFIPKRPAPSETAGEPPAEEDQALIEKPEEYQEYSSSSPEERAQAVPAPVEPPPAEDRDPQQEEFQTRQTPADQKTVSTFPYMILTILNLIAGGFSVHSIIKSRSWHQQQWRDSIRKEDLNKIKEAIEVFHKQNGRYPTRYNQEFIKFVRSSQQRIKDPKENKDTGFGGATYGYRYDNVVNPHTIETEKAEKDAKTYRLWCLLENKYDPEIDHYFDDIHHWVYMLTPEGNTRLLP